MLQKYLDAEVAILSGQEISMNGKSLKQADLVTIQKGRLDWERRVNAEQRTQTGGSSLRHQLPNFS